MAIHEVSSLQGWIQTLAWLGTFCGFIVAIFNYVSQQEQNRLQRKRELEQSELELRWKQAEAAKKILDEMLMSRLAKSAMRLMDGYDVEFKSQRDGSEKILLNDSVTALRVDVAFSEKTEKEKFICKSFDSLFYYMAMIEHYIKSNLILPKDVNFPLDYYLRKINKDNQLREAIQNFLKHYEQDRTIAFITRLENSNSQSEKLQKNNHEEFQKSQNGRLV